MTPVFSIIVVCLNPGEKLKATLQSIQMQTYQEYEIIIKDGLSTDGSLRFIKGIPAVRLIEKHDSGIYDAMNQAVKEAKGSYIYFLNCGDTFYNEFVLGEIADLIREQPTQAGIYYGNIFERMTGQVVFSNPHMDAFGCYRNVPCHQACFYQRALLEAHPFLTEYKVRADYEQFLWCFFEAKADCIYKPVLIADYEGGGFSETKENKLVSAREHREIVNRYMSRAQIFRFRFILWMTLAPLRTWAAGNEKTAGLYNKLKELLYRRRRD